MHRKKNYFAFLVVVFATTFLEAADFFAITFATGFFAFVAMIKTPFYYFLGLRIRLNYIMF